MIANILYVLLAIVMLGIIVTAHEFGHYLVGRLCGIGIVEFSVGFGPRLLGWERKGIKYSLRAIPLGGYCAFVGEDERNDDPHAMNNQPVWKRFVTVLSGPAMNFVLAFVLVMVMLCGFYYVAEDRAPVISQMVADMPAHAAGMLPGDRIVEINGAGVTGDGAGVDLIIDTIAACEEGAAVALTVERDGEILNFEVVPDLVEDAGGSRPQIGIQFDYNGRHMTFIEALKEAPGFMADTVRQMLDALRGLFFHGEGIEDVTGTVGIIYVVSQYAREGMHQILWLMYVITLNLGIMNLLPIPALDGGRLLFLIVEAIRRKPIPPEKEGMVHGVGMLLVLGLFVVLTFHDIIRLVTGGFKL